jgi:threonine dehydrogenase-like Zn-dependent dehydrogenase
MKSLVVDREGNLSVREVPVPAYGECQALVKMLSCGVCNGTDLKLIHGDFKNFSSYPAILGHEGVGRVVETGAGVVSFRPGDVVLLPFLEGETGGCYPAWGACSQYAVVGDAAAYIARGQGPGTPEFSEAYLAQTVIKDGDKVDPVSASMIVTFREVLSALRRFGFKPGQNGLIFGAGPVGLCFVKFLKLLGLETVVSAAVSDEKAEYARKMGADYAFNSRKCDLAGELKKLFPRGLDYAVDAVGLNALINQSMELIRYDGKICCYGISPKLSMELDWTKAPFNWTLEFNQWPSKREEGEAHGQIMDWINRGLLDPGDFISDVFDFDHIIDAFDLARNRKTTTRKIVIRF